MIGGEALSAARTGIRSVVLRPRPTPLAMAHASWHPGSLPGRRRRCSGRSGGRLPRVPRPSLRVTQPPGPCENSRHVRRLAEDSSSCCGDQRRASRFASHGGRLGRPRLGFQSERRTALFPGEFPKCGPILCDHGPAAVSRSSPHFRFSAQWMEPAVVFRQRRRIHTGVRREGRYICASALEEGGLLEEMDKWSAEVDRNLDAAGDEPRDGNAGDAEGTEGSSICVVNFYHFSEIGDPHGEVTRHAAFLEGRDIRGRIYISHQGINAQLSGTSPEAMEYADWVRKDTRFSTMLVQISHSPEGHAFPRLRLRFKPSLVQVEGGTLNLPITDPSARAVQLTPREWNERLDAANMLSIDDAPSSQNQQSLRNGIARRPYVLLDVRNGYEWDIGHFLGAQRPGVDCFKSTEFGLTETKPLSSDPLANVDKEAVDIMMYCTGGIRCDVFSTMLRQRGFKNLYTLKGGVSNYLKKEGARKWAGSLFVFDSRLAVPPYVYRIDEAGASSLESAPRDGLEIASSSVTKAFARCCWCGDLIPEPRHRNCANLDCNSLYLCCENCLVQQRGCCSQSCSSAPKLRPTLAGHQYARWHYYRPELPTPPKPPGYVSRRAMKRRRRKERRRGIQDHASSELTLNAQL